MGSLGKNEACLVVYDAILSLSLSALPSMELCFGKIPVLSFRVEEAEVLR